MSKIRFIFSFIKKEAVFFIALICAIVSSFFTDISLEKIKTYIDWNTLFILFSLMSVIAALQKCGVFKILANFMCKGVRSLQGLTAILVMLCFFSSMFITNDVALITFVPLAIALLTKYASPFYVMYIVILQTIAANTGSMLTPIGNPQNLFLFSKLNCPVYSFISILLPYSILSFLFLVAAILFVPRKSLDFIRKEDSAVNGKFQSLRTNIVTDISDSAAANKAKIKRKIETIVFLILFIMCLLAVVHVIPKHILAIIVLSCILLIDCSIISSVDFMLLFTFCAFFIFTGNIANIPEIKGFLELYVQNHEFLISVLVSQIISNVPATLLLYPFVLSTKDLLLGVNVGGLGTLVASLASLISYKLYIQALQEQKKCQISKENLLPSSLKYLAVFTALNLVFIAILFLLQSFLR
ncbi:MAG: anion permease [Treponema sp.]|nr:anion permease [Treponema sp.]